MPSPKRRADTEKATRVAGNARENEGRHARAGMREERRERAREDVVASWRMARADMVDGGWILARKRNEFREYAARFLPNNLRNLIELVLAHTQFRRLLKSIQAPADAVRNC